MLIYLEPGKRLEKNQSILNNFVENQLEINKQITNYLNKVMLLFCANKILLVDAVLMSCHLNHYHD